METSFDAAWMPRIRRAARQHRIAPQDVGDAVQSVCVDLLSQPLPEDETAVWRLVHRHLSRFSKSLHRHGSREPSMGDYREMFEALIPDPEPDAARDTVELGRALTVFLRDLTDDRFKLALACTILRQVQEDGDTSVAALARERQLSRQTVYHQLADLRACPAAHALRQTLQEA